MGYFNGSRPPGIVAPMRKAKPKIFVLVAAVFLVMAATACSASSTTTVAPAEGATDEPVEAVAVEEATSAPTEEPTAEPAVVPTPSPEPEQVAPTPEPQETEQSTEEPSSASGAPVGPCDLVDNSILEEVAGSEITTSSASDLQGLPRCIHTTASGARVQVASMPAADWAAAIPGLLDLVRDTGGFTDAENLAKLDRAEELLNGGGVEAGQAACDVFSLLVEIQGLPPGSAQVINFVPNAAAPLAVNGQRCADAVYTSVQLEADGIVDDQATVDRIDQALATVHAAGTGN